MADPFTLIRVVDTETTGIDDPCEMVEIGWTDVRLFPTGWEIESGPHSELVNPGMPITFPAMAVHHITDAEAATGVSPDEARQIIAGADFLSSHSWAFDSRFIKSQGPAICTFKCARTAWPELQSHGNGSIRYERGLCLGDPRTQPSHRAGPDTWVTAHILLDLLKIFSLDEMVEISRNPVLMLKIGFGKHFGMKFSELPWDYLDFIVNKSGMKDDPTKEDVVHTARVELQKRAGAEARQTSEPVRAEESRQVDPDAWRKQAEMF